MSTIYVSENAHSILLNYLISLNHTLVPIKATGFVYPEVASHADMYMCKLGAEPEAPVFCADFPPSSDLGYRYPENIKYNAVCMGNYFIHNLKYTSPLLLEKICQSKRKTLQVNQGYTKCNMVVINDRCAITSDQGIYASVNKYFDTISRSDLPPSERNSHGIHLLLIQPGHVRLGKFPYGFLGGASGRVGDEIIFNGNLKAHPDFERISEYISAQNLKVKYFEEYPLEDIGSIIEWRHQ
ncbi:DUF6873 family GME fold protein [Aminipila luticellarii]|uniref:DUF6873 domain-containing protein n=1 Tax=Aminipila luticellarii TaxID=2507160 RepID=A0A410PUF7_9FIRM|nr:hypothetical protein [Aminipila luticellarii]QAT42554.1 hypothetical protein EQM06_04575 [Aminipila luticellarii]